MPLILNSLYYQDMFGWKKNNLQSKKHLFSKLQDKSSVEKIIKKLSQRYVKRNGGYSRVVKAGFRYGDDAPMAIIELIDRDPLAKKVDVKKDPTQPPKTVSEPKPKEVAKKTKSKK